MAEEVELDADEAVAVADIEEDEEGLNSVSPAAAALETGEEEVVPELGVEETVPQFPVIPAPGVGVVPAYDPPYRTFLPGWGKTTAMFSMVAHPGAASTLATNGAG